MQINSNPLPVVEEFYSIQGEGFNSGKAAYFIRLAGCDVGCSWCDAKNTWKKEGGTLCGVNDIIGRIETCGAQAVVITGGEPTLHDLDALIAALKLNGVDIWMETSGTNPIPSDIDWVCLSPKRHKEPLESAFKAAHEIKIIIESEDDFVWAESCMQRVGPSCKLFLQPQWEKKTQALDVIVQYVKANPKWRISLQTHKFMDVP